MNITNYLPKRILDETYIVTLTDVIYIIYNKLSLEEKDNLLNNNEFKRELTKSLLNDCTGDYYKDFNNYLIYFTPSELLALIDIKELNNYFKDNHKEYILFSSCMDKDRNDTIRYILNNEEMFNLFFELNDNYYSLFSKIDYDLIKEAILKLDEIDFPYDNLFISCLDIDTQRKLLQENISNRTLKIIINRAALTVKNEFFKNDQRAIFLYKDFNIKSLI